MGNIDLTFLVTALISGIVVERIYYVWCGSMMNRLHQITGMDIVDAELCMSPRMNQKIFTWTKLFTLIYYSAILYSGVTGNVVILLFTIGLIVFIILAVECMAQFMIYARKKRNISDEEMREICKKSVEHFERGGN